ncbi:MAG: CBS domain-containing protein [Gammaproteobacteria bacterium]|nr:CBS domain-containing protein [Gammaproteobacteria bacterium]
MEIVSELLDSKGHDVWTTVPDSTVYDAIKLMAEKEIGALPVVDQGHLVGIVSERDYARKIILQGKSSKNAMVREIMTLRVIYTQPDQRIEDCMAIMNENRIRHMPVVDADKLVGILSLGDLVNVIIEQQQLMIEELETFIVG